MHSFFLPYTQMKLSNDITFRFLKNLSVNLILSHLWIPCSQGLSGRKSKEAWINIFYHKKGQQHHYNLLDHEVAIFYLCKKTWRFLFFPYLSRDSDSQFRTPCTSEQIKVKRCSDINEKPSFSFDQLKEF